MKRFRQQYLAYIYKPSWHAMEQTKRKRIPLSDPHPEHCFLTNKNQQGQIIKGLKKKVCKQYIYLSSLSYAVVIYRVGQIK